MRRKCIIVYIFIFRNFCGYNKAVFPVPIMFRCRFWPHRHSPTCKITVEMTWNRFLLARPSKHNMFQTAVVQMEFTQILYWSYILVYIYIYISRRVAWKQFNIHHSGMKAILYMNVLGLYVPRLTIFHKDIIAWIRVRILDRYIYIREYELE